MKLVYVPDWLSSYLTETNQPLSNLSSSLMTSIVSKVDVINYYKAQYDFAKFLFNQIDPSMIYKTDPMAIMLHNPAVPEFQLYVKTQSKDTMPFSPEEFACTVEHDPNESVVYIIGSCDTGQSLGKSHTVAQAILSKIFKSGQAHIRVENQFTDKGTVLRENPILAQLYVKSIIS